MKNTTKYTEEISVFKTIFILWLLLLVLIAGFVFTQPEDTDMFNQYSISYHSKNFQNEQVVEFNDEGFEAFIREAMDKPDGFIYVEELENVRQISAINDKYKIDSLIDLRYFVNLDYLKM